MAKRTYAQSAIAASHRFSANADAHYSRRVAFVGLKITSECQSYTGDLSWLNHIPHWNQARPINGRDELFPTRPFWLVNPYSEGSLACNERLSHDKSHCERMVVAAYTGESSLIAFVMYE